MSVPRKEVALTVIAKRLELEILFPSASHSTTARQTMRAVKGWGFKGNTREQALLWVRNELARTREQ
jgi:hypothetical protein